MIKARVIDYYEIECPILCGTLWTGLLYGSEIPLNLTFN